MRVVVVMMAYRVEVLNVAGMGCLYMTNDQRQPYGDAGAHESAEPV